MIASEIRLNKIESGTDVDIIISETGDLPAYQIDYEDGNKYVAFVDRFYGILSDHSIVFIAEEWMLDPYFNKWSLKYTGKFEESKIFLGDNVLVRLSDGKYQKALTAEELAENPTLVPEFMRVQQGMLIPLLYPLLQSAMKYRHENEG